MKLHKKSQAFAIFLTLFAIIMIIAVFLTAKSQLNKITGSKEFGASAYSLQKIVIQSYSINSYISSNAEQSFKNAIIDMSLDGGIYNKTDMIYRNATMLFTSKDKSGHNCFNPKNNLTTEMNYFMGLNITFLIKNYGSKLLDHSKFNNQLINFPDAYLDPFTCALKINNGKQGNTYVMSSSKNIFLKVYDTQPIENGYISPLGSSTIPKSIAFCTSKANLEGANPGACVIKSKEYSKLMYVIDYLASENIYVTIIPTSDSCFKIEQKNTGSYYQDSILSNSMEQPDLKTVLTKDFKDIIELEKNSNDKYCLK